MTEHTRPSKATINADRADAGMAHEADRVPTAEEEARAEALELDPQAASSAREAAERGAHQRGEGRIDR